MSDIAIFVTDIDITASGLQVLGKARLSSDGGQVFWDVTVACDALASIVNQSCRDAAIAAAEDAGYTIGLLDKKTLFAAATDV